MRVSEVVRRLRVRGLAFVMTSFGVWAEVVKADLRTALGEAIERRGDFPVPVQVDAEGDLWIG